MRQIKFRAWDTQDNRYIADFTNYAAWEAKGKGENAWRNDRYILEQFTGLCDGTKWEDLTEAERESWVRQGNSQSEWHGKEIYDGDIVVLKKQKRNNLVAVKLEVYWNMNRMYWGLNPIRRPEWRNRSSDVANLTYCTRCEVIGNIHTGEAK